MTIYSLRLFKSKQTPILLAYSEDISSFPFYARITNSPSEFLLFTSRTFAENILPGNFESCIKGDYKIFVHHRLDGLISVIITDKLYQKRVAFEVVSKAVKLFQAEDHNWDWELWEEDSENGYNVSNQKLTKLIQDYTEPDKEDNLLKVSKQLSETKEIMGESVNKLLERGDKIDELVDKSKDLSRKSKDFYKKSKQMNSWCGSCVIM